MPSSQIKGLEAERSEEEDSGGGGKDGLQVKPIRLY
jgi:hypothetical protein